MIHILITHTDGALNFSVHNSSEEAFRQIQKDVTHITSGEVLGTEYANSLELSNAISESAYDLSWTISPAFHSADVLLCEADGHAVHAETAVITNVGDPLVAEIHV